jgi:hypothetical protein
MSDIDSPPVVPEPPHYKLTLGEKHAPGLIDFEEKSCDFFTYFLGKFIDKQEMMTKQQYENLLRSKVVEFVKSFNGFGVDDIKKPSNASDNGIEAEKGKEPTRGMAYGDICWPFKEDKGLNKAYSENKILGFSSCAVVIRSLWQLLGARHCIYINPPYGKKQDGWVMNYLRDYAVYCGAFSGSFPPSNEPPERSDGLNDKKIPCDPISTTLTEKNFFPKQGDVLFLQKANGTKAHVLTIVEISDDKITSCDGGQGQFIISQKTKDNKTVQVTVKDNPCNGIRLRTRTLEYSKKVERGSNYMLKDKYGDTKYITGWVDITKLEFLGDLIIPHRNLGKVIGTKPDGTEDRVKYYLPEPSGD